MQIIRNILNYALRAVLLLLGIGTFVLSGCHHIALDREKLNAAEAAPSRGRFVATSMGQMHVTVTGPPTGKNVILVHGTGAWGGLWQDTADRLGQQGYRAIAVDLPPFGYSERPVLSDYSRSTQARRIVALAKAMGLVRPALVGHSFGGGPAAEAAMLWPNGFSKLVLVDPALGINAPPSDVPILLRPLPLRRMIISATATNPWLTRMLLKSLLYRKDRAQTRYVDILKQPLRRKSTTAAYADWLPTLLTSDPNAASAHSDSYHRLPMPLVLIWGDQDSVTPLDQLARIRAAAPQAEVRLLNNVGHIPQIEDPLAFQAALLDALR